MDGNPLYIYSEKENPKPHSETHPKYLFLLFVNATLYLLHACCCHKFSAFNLSLRLKFLHQSASYLFLKPECCNHCFFMLITTIHSQLLIWFLHLTIIMVPDVCLKGVIMSITIIHSQLLICFPYLSCLKVPDVCLPLSNQLAFIAKLFYRCTDCCAHFGSCVCSH